MIAAPVTRCKFIRKFAFCRPGQFHFGKALCGLAATAIGLALVSASFAIDDWPHWRGPDRNDVSTETGLLKSWPDSGPKQVWINRDAGLGYAGFSIVDNRLFTMGLENNREFALCLDANTGEELWRTPIAGKFKNGWGDGPRSTPSVDGERVYFMFAGGTLACLNAKDGKEAWSVNMSDFGGKVPKWGFAESPLVDDGKVIFTPGGDQGAIAAVDKLTGKKIWQTTDFKISEKGRRGKKDNRAHYSSVLPVEFNGEKTYVQLVPNAIVAISGVDGSVVWQSEWEGAIAVIPSPIYVDGKVYVSSGYNAGSKMIEIGSDNKAEEIWRNRVMKNHHGGVILVDDHLYGYSDGAGFVCQNLSDGEMVWNNKSDIKKGSVSYADGLFYYIEERSGNVLLIEANREGVDVKAEFKLDPQTKRRSPSGAIWVHPVISNGKLYLRDQEIIYCYDVKN